MARRDGNDLEMRFKLLQEAVWNNGDKLSRILEHVIAHEVHLLKLLHIVETASQKLGIMLNNDKPQKRPPK